jgi:hypothetical protein
MVLFLHEIVQNHIILFIGFEVFTAVIMSSTVFTDIIPWPESASELC